MTKMARPVATIARLEPRGRAIRRYRSPRKVLVLAAPAAACAIVLIAYLL